ncbi:MAG: substrate-binding domain-containing protein [Solobacterium sp.]|nr:substrate-binding domain-containing protein [Solobacterium sp.]
MKRNRIWFILLIAAVLLGLFGLRYLSRTDLRDTDTPMVAVSVVVDDSTNGRWTRFQAGIEQAADDYRVALSYAVTPKFNSISDEEAVIRSEASAADAVIVQLIDTSDTVELISSLCAERVLGLVDTDAPAEAGDNFASITADNTAIGTALADLLKEQYGDKLRDMTVGILYGNQKMRSMQERLAGFREGIAQSGAEIFWEGSGTAWESAGLPDIVIALDNDSLENAADALETGEEAPALYGVGCSDKTIYALDHGQISAMIVPDEFQMGYLALSDVVARINAPNIPMLPREIPFTVITRTNLYDPANAAFLFPVIN